MITKLTKTEEVSSSRYVKYNADGGIIYDLAPPGKLSPIRLADVDKYHIEGSAIFQMNEYTCDIAIVYHETITEIVIESYSSVGSGSERDILWRIYMDIMSKLPSLINMDERPPWYVVVENIVVDTVFVTHHPYHMMIEDSLDIEKIKVWSCFNRDTLLAELTSDELRYPYPKHRFFDITKYREWIRSVKDDT